MGLASAKPGSTQTLIRPTVRPATTTVRPAQADWRLSAPVATTMQVSRLRLGQTSACVTSISTRIRLRVTRCSTASRAMGPVRRVRMARRLGAQAVSRTRSWIAPHLAAVAVYPPTSRISRRQVAHRDTSPALRVLAVSLVPARRATRTPTQTRFSLRRLHPRNVCATTTTGRTPTPPTANRATAAVRLATTPRRTSARSAEIR
jgi:hypothetical protein